MKQIYMCDQSFHDHACFINSTETDVESTTLAVMYAYIFLWYFCTGLKIRY